MLEQGINAITLLDYVLYYHHRVLLVTRIYIWQDSPSSGRISGSMTLPFTSPLGFYRDKVVGLQWESSYTRLVTDYQLEAPLKLLSGEDKCRLPCRQTNTPQQHFAGLV